MRNQSIPFLLLLLAAACLVCACTPEMMPSPLAQVTSAPTLTVPAAQPTAPTVTVPTAQPAAPTNAPTAVSPTPILPGKLTPVALPTVPPIAIQESPAMNEVPLPTPLDPQMLDVVTQVKADLAKRLSIDPTQIELEAISSVTWPDSSLGCPKPGMAYTQVMVDGVRIRLMAGGQTYEYHGGGGRTPTFCK